MNISQFTKQYQLQKTLRFSLIPVEETADYIENYGSSYLRALVAEDEQRAHDYEQMKSLLDEMHRDYITQRLESLAEQGTGELVITPEQLEQAYQTYTTMKSATANDALEKEWLDIQADLRKKLVLLFSDNKDLFGKSAIVKTLPEYLKRERRWDEHQALVESFARFTTYFSGFDTNRKNMYVSDDKRTSIANRTINENLIKFFDNIISYRQIREKFPELEFLDVDTETLTKLGVRLCDDVFQPRFFLNLVSQCGIDLFHSLIGSKKDASGNGNDGLNQQINLFRQKHGFKPRELPKLVRLHKQILGESSSESFRYEPIKNDKELIDRLSLLIDEMHVRGGHASKLREALGLLVVADPTQTYIRGNALASISSSWLGAYRVLPSAVESWAKSNFNRAAEQKKYLRPLTEGKGVYSLSEIENALAHFLTELDEKSDDYALVTKGQNENGQKLVDFFQRRFLEFESQINERVEQVKPILVSGGISASRRPPKSKDEQDQGGQGFHEVSNIQKLMDAYVKLLGEFRPLHLKYKGKPMVVGEQDLSFYNPFSELMEVVEGNVLPLFNQARNHLSKKAYQLDKVKVNFGNPNLMAGWDANKESDNSCIILEKAGNYYLGVMHPKHRHLFNYSLSIDDIGKSKTQERKERLRNEIVGGADTYRKLIYKLLPGANKMLPKVFFSSSRIDFFSPPNSVLRIRNTASHTESGTPQKGFKKEPFSLEDCHTMIDFFKQSIAKHTDWRQFEFEFSDTKKYRGINDFYREVEEQGYRIDFDDIDSEYIKECVATEKLFLFQIYNKDFSPKSTGKPNLHTLFWRGLFEEQNTKDVVLKLNGEAEMFFRRHSLKKSEVARHPANQVIAQKNGDGHSKFPYTIYQHKRFTRDSFFLHVPITLNHKSPKKPSRFNDAINRAIQEDTYVIGVDRGERHLLYYCVIDPQGQIVEDGQHSLNIINGVDYRAKLDEREKQRDQARKSWTSIENIKELKAGYLSHVVHKVAQLAVKYKAVICLEDLNKGFKRGRFKIEKQVYQKFEKALIDKLNYLVFKDTEPLDQPGHYLNAYQLTAPFESFEKLGKQSGLLYYVRADYTSKICPATGFVNLLKPYYKSVEQAKQFIANLSSVRFNVAKDYFEIDFDYRQTNPTTKKGKARSQWCVCSHGERLQNKRNGNQWKTVEVYPTQELKALFDRHQIDYAGEDNLIELILEQDKREFFETFLWCLRMTLQMRNSRSNSEEDWMISPVLDSQGRFYDSRVASPNLPKDADANGAYHIALKGLWNLRKIRQHDWQAEKPARLKLDLSNEDWFEYASTRFSDV